MTILVILICLVGLAVALALVIGVVILIVRSASRGRELEQRLGAIEAELREMKKRLPS